MQIVPLDPVPNQQVQCQLGGQACTVVVQQMAYGLFVSLFSNDALVVQTVIAENLNRIVRNAYFGFAGDFMFFDAEGAADPVYTGLGSRFLLVYLEAADLAAAGVAG